jgi:hypothetical protein
MIKTGLVPVPLVVAMIAGCEKEDRDMTPVLFSLPAARARGEIFAPGTVSTDDQLEMGCAISPDGKEIYFGRAVPGGPDWGIWVARDVDGTLSQPEVAPFSGVFRDFNPFMTPDGQHLIFYRESFGESETREGSWIVDREGGTWGDPRYLIDEYHVTTPDLKTYYFIFVPGAESNRSAPGKARELGVSILEHGHLTESKCMPGDINSPYWDAHGFISSDGSFMVFDSARPKGFDDFDIYVSFRRSDNTWGPAHNLGKTINRGERSMPALTADAAYLFFSAEGDIWWAPADIIGELRDR